MVESSSYVVVGNGIAGITAAETLRQEQPSAEITIIAEESAPACYRPALKDYLVGEVSEETLFARRPGFYKNKSLRFIPDRVVEIATDRRQLQLRGGRSISYDYLLLATGARARRLKCPGSDLKGVLTLRSVADYQLAVHSLETARRVVVYGGGPLALETVDMLHRRGLQITHLLLRRNLWADVLDRTASELILRQEQEAGVDVHFNEEIAEIVGKQGQLIGLITNNGARIPCDMLVTAIGSEPVIDFIKASGINCQRGVMVDQSMRTSAVGVYAAGDVAEILDPLTGQTRITGQWYPAIQQGRAAAYSMLGMLGSLRLRHAASYSNAYLRAINTFSLFGFEMASIGFTNISAPAYQEIVAESGTHIYSKALLKNGVPVGMLTFNGHRDTLAFKRAIDHAVDLTSVAPCLFNSNFKLATWLDAQKVPAPILAVRKTAARPASSLPPTTSPIAAVSSAPAASQAFSKFPTRSMKSQFMPAAPLLELTDEEQDGSLVEALPPPDSNPYALPVIKVGRSRNAWGGEEAGRFAKAPENLQNGIPTGAFLAPVNLVRNAQILTTGEEEIDRVPTLSVLPGSSGVTLAPLWAHTSLNQDGPVTIGRESGSMMVINHQSISRHHAEIIGANGVYYLRDLGSKNGTFINERRLAPGRKYSLKPRDLIRIGNLMTYQFHLSDYV